jgi:hypothetical protein
MAYMETRSEKLGTEGKVFSTSGTMRLGKYSRNAGSMVCVFEGI